MSDGRPSATQPLIRVLLADDDPIFCQLMASRLARLPADVLTVSDGRDAWDLIGKDAFDLAIVDLDMPGLDGVTLTRCLRGHPGTKHMTIVVCSARDRAEEVQEALEAGASSYLLKPLKWSMFEAHIRNLLHNVQEAKAARAQVAVLNSQLDDKDEAFAQMLRHVESTAAALAACPTFRTLVTRYQNANQGDAVPASG